MNTKVDQIADQIYRLSTCIPEVAPGGCQSGRSIRAIPPVDRLTVVPASEASWNDLTAILGTTNAGQCQCQRFKVRGCIWRDSTQEERTGMLCEQTGCDDPNAATTSGLVGYLDDESVGWVAVEPRTAYFKLRTSRVPWTGRDEDKDDDGIWAVTCFVVRKGYRGRGLLVLFS